MVDTVPRIGIGDIARALPAGSRARATVRVVVNGRPEVLDVEFVPRYFGGRGAPHFLCPMPMCSCRVWHLYFRDDPAGGGCARLMCRKCAALTYRSQCTKRRGLHRLRDLRRRIGASANPLAPLPEKPPYVRRDYWARSIAKLAAAETVLAAELHGILPRVRRRLKP